MISRKNNIKNIRKEISDFQNLKPISYLVIDDFIEKEIYQGADREILLNGYSILQEDIGEMRKNKTVYLKGNTLTDVYNFFISKEFEEYLSSIFTSPCKREFSISQQQISEKCGSQGMIAQLYQKSDTFGWHVDGHDEKISLGAFTYYLGGYQGEWERSYGGLLEFGTGKWGNIHSYHDITPKKNRIVFILYSDNAFHRVTPNVSSFSRLSLQSTIIKK